MFFSNFMFSVNNLFFTQLEAVHPLMVNRKNHKQHDQIRIFNLYDSSILISVILEIRRNHTHSFCLAPFSSIFTTTSCIRLSSITDPVPANGWIKSTEIWQKINSTIPAFFLLCNTESWTKDPQVSLSLWLLERPQQFSSDRSN